ncbi:MAG: EamA family transporter [Actinomycetaceae bacterium]|nr:EamA family transporter [Actinomycetaceae bacterium]
MSAQKDSYDQMRLDVLPAPLIFILSGVSNYGGTALATALLFSFIPAHTVAWYRAVVTAVFLLAWRRPFRRGLTLKDLVTSTIFGIMTIGMNMVFYLAVDRIALGTAVTIEFLGPVTVAIVMGRGLKTRVATLLAVLGVVSIGGFGLDLSDPSQLLGTFFALGAGAMWSGYIVIGAHVASKRSGIDSLAIGMATGSIATLPFVGKSALIPLVSGWWPFLVIVAVGVLSSLLPYTIEQSVLRRLGSDNFALMSALFPVISTFVALVVLFQIPNMWEVVGIVSVSVAVALVNYHPRGHGRIKRVPKRVS